MCQCSDVGGGRDAPRLMRGMMLQRVHRLAMMMLRCGLMLW